MSFRLVDIGLRQQTKANLLIELLTPTLFSIVIVVQLHFFHSPLVKNINQILNNRKFLKSKKKTAQNLIETPGVAGNSMGKNALEETIVPNITTDIHVDRTPVTSKIMGYYTSLTSTLWLFAELHIQKMICVTAMVVAIQQVIF